MTHGLANVFVNNQRVEDLDDPALKIKDIITAYGRDPARCIVYRLESEEEGEGNRVDLEEHVDLAQIRGNLYLRCETRRTEAMAPSTEPRGAEGEGLSETEQVPTYEDALGDAETEHTLAAEEREQEELLSPETGKHAAGDPTGHRFYDRDPDQKWGEGTWERTPQTGVNTGEPRALGSELRSPRPPRRPSSRSTGKRARQRGNVSASTTSTRTSAARRKNKDAPTSRRSGR